MGRAEKLREIAASRLSSVIAVCANLENPHNAAAIIRTCEALGLLEVFVIEEKHPFSPSPKITQGAEKWVRVRHFRRAEPALLELKSRGFRIFAAAPNGVMVLEDLPVDSPLALVFGNEVEGVGPEILAHCDGSFRIPMFGLTQSFNVSVAAGISLYVVASARRRFLGRLGDLSPAEQEALVREYLAGGRGPGGEL